MLDKATTTQPHQSLALGLILGQGGAKARQARQTDPEGRQDQTRPRQAGGDRTGERRPTHPAKSPRQRKEGKGGWRGAANPGRGAHRFAVGEQERKAPRAKPP